MPLQPGTRFGPFEITAAIGAGGMGEVYSARDTKLNRDVALKVLPEGFAGDRDRLMRFSREAQTLATLNHPNIAQIYGIEEAPARQEETSGVLSGGVGSEKPSDVFSRALVMELVDGDDLSDRIARGAMPLEDVLPIARQIAGALEAAHEAGIVHRDLKPANIKVKADGTVKVLDFGLAKALDTGTSTSGPQNFRTSGPHTVSAGDLATVTSPALTALGLILGTAAYMSPEQAKGRPVDRRADIWAFGVVLYEMITGRRLFGAETVGEVLAAVLRADIDLSDLPPDTPVSIRRLLARCLDRDPRSRLQHIGEARIALESRDAEPDPPPTARPAGRRAAWTTVAATAVVTAALASLVVWNLKPDAMPVDPITFTIVEEAVGHQAVSPDGRLVAYTTNGDQDIWVRDLGDLEPRLVASVSDLRSVAAPALFWSWDSSELGYSADGSLWRVGKDGGTPVEICRLENYAATGATWGPDDRIVFGSWRGGLYEVPSNGASDPVLLVEATDGIEDFHAPRFLPDGALTYDPHWIEPHETELHIRRRAETTTLAGVANGAYTQGHLISARQGANAGLWATPFDLDRLAITGDPVRVVPNVTRYAASPGGTLVYNTRPAGRRFPPSHLGWRDAAGDLTMLPGDPRPFRDLALSPDGSAVAAIVADRGQDSIVLVDVARGSLVPLVAPSAAEKSGLRWSWDGRFVLFSEQRGFVDYIVGVPADGSRQPRDIVQGLAPEPAPDGRSLVFERDERGRRSLWTILIDDYQPSGDPRLLRESPESVEHPAVSPDGALVAYAQGPPMAGRFSSAYTVFLSRLPDGTGQWPVSVGGGNLPTWDRRTGNLIYVNGTDVMTVPITPGAEPVIGPPQRLMPLYDLNRMRDGRPRIGLSPDGLRQLVRQPVAAADAASERLVVVRPLPLPR